MKNIFLYCIIFCSNIFAHAQASQGSSPWYIPDHVKLQFAGNIGFLSAGPGFLHGKNKLETDLMLGFLPRGIGGDDIVSLTAKTTCMPWKFSMKNSVVFYPLTIGGYLSYSFGSQFDTILPNEYPRGYYWWATSLRLGAYLGGQVELPISATPSRALAFYYEFTTYDLIFLSYIQNLKYLRLSDVVSLSLGMKMIF